MARRPKPPLAAEDTPDTPAHGARKLPDPAGAVRSDLSEADAAPPGEPADGIEAFEVGVRFLRDATEQYNYESEQRPEADHELTGEPVAQLISDATLEAAGQSDFSVPVSAALSDDPPEVLAEPTAAAVDLTSNAIHAASLFDQPVAGLDPDAEEDAAEEDPDLALAAPLREPIVASDDPSDVDDERRDEIQRAFDERVKRRLRVTQLPKERAAARHAARVVQTSRRAADIVREMTGLDDTVTALAALETVAGAIVRRILPAEAGHFISQLPSELHSTLLALPAGPDRNITRETIEAELASRLSLAPERAAALAQGVGAALRVLLPNGQLEDTRAQLPLDIGALLPDRVVHQNP